jgi:SAM-dependent methyltransferase
MLRRKSDMCAMTDWNSCYEQKETPWEKGKPTPVLGDVMVRHAEAFRGRVLVPGCGIGHDARWLAEHGMEVTGADIAPLAIEGAKAWDPESKVDFRLVDLFALPDDLRGAFDLVWEHTCLCALPLDLRTRYVKGVKSSLKGGGIVAGVFFINPEMDPGEEGPPFGIGVEDLEKLWRDEGFEVVDSWVPEVGYEGRVGRERAMVLRRFA